MTGLTLQACPTLPGGVGVAGANVCSATNGLHIAVAYRAIIPIIVFVVGALVLLIVAAVLPRRSRPGLYPSLTALIATFGLAGSVWEWYDLGTRSGTAVIGGQVLYDRFTVLFYILVTVATILSSATADSYLRREGLDGVESYVLMLMSATGAMLMAASGSLIMLFLGLEIMSIALYVMAAYHRRRRQSGEAGLKYFILGSFSSALFLYGVALVYGATGSVYIVLIANYFTQSVPVNNGVLLAGMALLIVGLGFKVAAVPFHFWTPDVYEGSPTPFTGYMAAVAKAGGFAGLLRVLTEALGRQQADWRPAIWLIAVLTLVVGSLMAIAQKDLKRMMAYSSISQAGYVLVGVQAGTAAGTAGALFYLFTYLFVIIGTFAVIEVVQGRGEQRNDLGAIRGLARRQPALAALMLVFLLAQAGVPFTSGFLAKFYVIEASVGQGQYWLAIIAMLAAAVAAFFYLRIALLMYASPSEEATPAFALAPAAASSATPATPAASAVPASSAAPAASAIPASSAAPAPAPTPVQAGSSYTPTTVAALPEPDVFGAGLQPVPSLDGDLPAFELASPPTSPLRIPPALNVVLVVCAAFTIAAGVSPFAIDFAKAATALF
jgi:NADH-quinone oxidoreductase subunit N